MSNVDNVLPYDAAYLEAAKEDPDLHHLSTLLYEGHAAGDARATFALAIEYFGEGYGLVAVDKIHAVELLRQGAEAGNVDAIHNLGIEYQAGKRVKKNKRKALKLFTRAASRGNAHSMYSVGCMLYWGLGNSASTSSASYEGSPASASRSATIASGKSARMDMWP